MGNIIIANVSITGLRPLIWHVFGPNAIPLEKQERTGVAGHDPEEWRKTYLATKDGQLYLPSSYIFSCIREGAKHTKRSRGSLQPYIGATMQVTNDVLLIDRFMPIDGTIPPSNDKEAPVYIDICSVRNPATKGRNVRYRVAASKGWKTEFALMWDKTVVSRNEMESAVIDAGRLVGLADGRSIGNGRFTIDSFEVADA